MLGYLTRFIFSILSFFHSHIISPAVLWNEDVILGVCEEVLRALVRQTFSEIQRFLSGLVTFVLSVFKHGYRDKLRKTWDDKSAWQQSWQRGADRPSTLNDIVASMHPSPTDDKVETDVNISTDQDDKEPRKEPTTMGYRNGFRRIASFQNLSSCLPNLSSLITGRRRKESSKFRKVRSYPNVLSAASGSGTLTRQRSLAAFPSGQLQMEHSDMFVQQSGMGVVAPRRGLLEDAKISSELALARLFAFLRAFIRRLFFLPVDPSASSSTKASVAKKSLRRRSIYSRFSISRLVTSTLSWTKRGFFKSKSDTLTKSPTADERPQRARLVRSRSAHICMDDIVGGPSQSVERITPGLTPTSEVAGSGRHGGGLHSLRRVQSSGNLETLRHRRDGPVSTSDAIKMSGYPLEVHTVTTQDGYILTMERIPRPGCKDVVFFMHGVLDTSMGWISAGVTGSQAFAAWEAGFDVWLGNTRSNPPCLHQDPAVMSGSAYWKFTVNDLGMADISSQLDRIHDVKCNELGAGQSRNSSGNEAAAEMLPRMSTSAPKTVRHVVSDPSALLRTETSSGLNMLDGREKTPASASDLQAESKMSLTQAARTEHARGQRASPPFRTLTPPDALPEDSPAQVLHGSHSNGSLSVESAAHVPSTPAGDAQAEQNSAFASYPSFARRRSEQSNKLRSSNSDGNLSSTPALSTKTWNGTDSEKCLDAHSPSPLTRQVTLQVPGKKVCSVKTFTLAAYSEQMFTTPAGSSRGLTNGDTSLPELEEEVLLPAWRRGSMEKTMISKTTSSSAVPCPQHSSAAASSRARRSVDQSPVVLKTSSNANSTGRPAPSYGGGLFKRANSHGDIISLTMGASNALQAAALQEKSKKKHQHRDVPSPNHGSNKAAVPPCVSLPPAKETWCDPETQLSNTVAAARAAGEPYYLRAVGHSLGGMALMIHTVMRARAGLPSHVHRLVLLTPAGFHYDYPRVFARLVVFKLFADVRALPSVNELQQLMISFILNGDASQWDRAVQIPHYSEVSMPAMAVHMMLHVAQCSHAGRFQLFDYGSREENAAHYDGLTSPPDIAEEYWRLRDCGIPVDLVAGRRDGIITPRNVQGHLRKLEEHGVNVSYKEFDFGHLDFTFAVKEDLRLHFLRLLKK
eukprot:gene32016-16537_t